MSVAASRLLPPPYWFLNGDAWHATQVILGYQSRSNIDDLCINPKDKDIPRYWTDCDFIVVMRDEKVARNKKTSEDGVKARKAMAGDGADGAGAGGAGGATGGGKRGSVTISGASTLGGEGGGRRGSLLPPRDFATGGGHHHGGGGDGNLQQVRDTPLAVSLTSADPRFPIADPQSLNLVCHSPITDQRTPPITSSASTKRLRKAFASTDPRNAFASTDHQPAHAALTTPPALQSLQVLSRVAASLAVAAGGAATARVDVPFSTSSPMGFTVAEKREVREEIERDRNCDDKSTAEFSCGQAHGVVFASQPINRHTFTSSLLYSHGSHSRAPLSPAFNSFSPVHGRGVVGAARGGGAGGWGGGRTRGSDPGMGREQRFWQALRHAPGDDAGPWWWSVMHNGKGAGRGTGNTPPVRVQHSVRVRVLCCDH